MNKIKNYIKSTLLSILIVPMTLSPQIAGSSLENTLVNGPYIGEISIDPFFGYPTLREICSCESNLKHYENDGVTVLRGKVNPNDIGICQINIFYHEEKISELGIDIFTKSGNIDYAKNLYKREGDAPWIHSKSCWA